jgi:hypothetical protein
LRRRSGRFGRVLPYIPAHFERFQNSRAGFGWVQGGVFLKENATWRLRLLDTAIREPLKTPSFMEEYTMDSIGPLLLWLMFLMARAEVTLRPARKVLSGLRAAWGAFEMSSETVRRGLA